MSDQSDQGTTALLITLIAALAAAALFATTKNQKEKSNIAYNSFKAPPAPKKVNDLKTIFSRAVADNNAPLTAERFSVLLQSSGLSQTELGKILKVDQSNISGWLRGARSIPQKYAKTIYQLCSDPIAERVLAIGALADFSDNDVNQILGALTEAQKQWKGQSDRQSAA
jgi:transcriptional regulator with XRE-family HTH domain